ncbi:MAG: ATP phosphoribosyltransferase [Rhodomicrobiaceae bacterium]|jgi:ATP phosphoribosyltransferase
MTETLTIAVPSKGRLMEETSNFFRARGLNLQKIGHDRGYQGEIEGYDDIDIVYLSASEIAYQLKTGQIHMGVTGEDLVRENIIGVDQKVEFLKRLGFGFADVVVAVPDCWLDVHTMADLEEMAMEFRRRHKRRLKVATKYMNLTRQFFTKKAVAGYRIVESLGATEGTPMGGTADLIVDITSTGETLEANHLRILDDGLMLKSEANLVASRAAEWSGGAAEIRLDIMSKLNSDPA